MNKKTFLAVAAVALIAVALAFFSTATRQEAEDAVAGGGRMFPALPDTINTVEVLSVRTRDGILTIQKSGNGWMVLERNGYPARTTTVRTVLVGLAELEKLEPKTKSPERYADLGVEDVDAEGSASTEVVVLNGAGERLAAALVGRVKWDVGGGMPGLYLRKPGEAQSWLVRGRLGLATDASDWLVREVLHVAPERIKGITMHHPDGETWTAEKASRDDKHLFISGETLRDKFALDGTASVFQNLTMDDVRPGDDIAMAEKFIHRAEYQTFDGMVIKTRLADVMGEHWLWLKVSGGSDEAKRLAGLTAGWAYRIPAFKAARLSKRLADLKKKPKQVDAGAPAPGQAVSPAH